MEWIGQVTYHTADVDGIKVFYRQAGPAHAPVVLLLHGFPESSHMFRLVVSIRNGDGLLRRKLDGRCVR